jgi:hypothetical protein
MKRELKSKGDCGELNVKDLNWLYGGRVLWTAKFIVKGNWKRR